ncbi:MAG: DUF4190 domain-containing protein [Lachnospiraceae bacterium]|nr:DUF4190 domain-containing protein [Lachnospiraceae bacterium]
MDNDDLFYGEKTPEPSNNAQYNQPGGGNPYMQNNQSGGGNPYTQNNQSGGGNPYNWGDPYGYNPQPPVSSSNPLAVISLICGLFSLFCCFCPIISPIMALAGIITALCSKRKQPFSGLAIAGLITSILGLIAFALLIISAVSMMSNPTFWREFFEQLKTQDPATYEQLKEILRTNEPELYNEIFGALKGAILHLIH